MKREFTLEDAKAAANVLVRLPLVFEVLVFGSIARAGRGKDIDLALIVPLPFAEGFILKASLFDGSTDVATFRKTIAIEVLGPGFEMLLEEVSGVLPPHEGTILDLMLLPPNWRDYAKEFENTPLFRPEFWTNLMQEAVRLA